MSCRGRQALLVLPDSGKPLWLLFPAYVCPYSLPTLHGISLNHTAHVHTKVLTHVTAAAAAATDAAANAAADAAASAAAANAAVAAAVAANAAAGDAGTAAAAVMQQALWCTHGCVLTQNCCAESITSLSRMACHRCLSCDTDLRLQRSLQQGRPPGKPPLLPRLLAPDATSPATYNASAQTSDPGMHRQT